MLQPKLNFNTRNGEQQITHKPATNWTHNTITSTTQVIDRIKKRKTAIPELDWRTLDRDGKLQLFTFTDSDLYALLFKVVVQTRYCFLLLRIGLSFHFLLHFFFFVPICSCWWAVGRVWRCSSLFLNVLVSWWLFKFLNWFGLIESCWDNVYT